MKAILVILTCVLAVSNAVPLTNSAKEVEASNLDLNGPQPVDEIVAIKDDSDLTPSKRVARHYGGVSVGFAVPVVSYGYPIGYGGYGYGGYGYGYGGGYGGGYGYRPYYGGYRRHHHHHHW